MIIICGIVSNGLEAIRLVLPPAQIDHTFPWPPCKFIGSDPPLFSPRNEPIMYILNPPRKALRAWIRCSNTILDKGATTRVKPSVSLISHLIRFVSKDASSVLTFVLKLILVPVPHRAHQWTSCLHLLSCFTSKYTIYSIYLEGIHEADLKSRIYGCTIKASKLINGNSRSQYDISTVREVIVSALVKLDSWVHAGFYLLRLSADDKEQALLPSQNHLLPREPDGNLRGMIHRSLISP